MPTVSEPAPAAAVALAAVVPVGVLLTAGDGTVAYTNPAFAEVFGPPAEPVPAGTALAELAEPEPYRHAAALWRPDAGLHRYRLPTGRVVEGAWHRLDGSACLVVTDVTGDALVRRRLRRHNRAVAELVATKTELVSALLHEVRTPLTAARTMADLLPEPAADALAAEAVQGLRRNLRRLAEVTGEIATISGIETGARELATAELDLEAVLAEVAAEFDPPVPVRDTDQVAVAVGDRGLLAEVFARLIAAVRALGGIPASGAPVEAALDDGQWRLCLPLPADAPTDRLFTTTGGHGNATALMFARAVLGRHGGTVGIEHESLTVRLPLARP